MVTAVLVCLTGFGIFQHGGFGKEHALGIVTLLVLALAVYAERSQLSGRWTAYVCTVTGVLGLLFLIGAGLQVILLRLLT